MIELVTRRVEPSDGGGEGDAHNVHEDRVDGDCVESQHRRVEPDPPEVGAGIDDKLALRIPVCDVVEENLDQTVVLKARNALVHGLVVARESLGFGVTPRVNDEVRTELLEGWVVVDLGDGAVVAGGIRGEEHNGVMWLDIPVPAAGGAHAGFSDDGRKNG